MLESLKIKNFRSCEDTFVSLGEPLVALLGKNGVGKTNVLHAIQLAADLCIGEGESNFSLYPKDRANPTEFILVFKVNRLRHTYSFSRTSPIGGTDLFAESLTRENESLFVRKGEYLESPDSGLPGKLRIGTRAASLSTLLQILPESSPATKGLRPVADYIRSIRYYPLLQGFQEHTYDRSSFIEASKYDAWKSDLAQGKRTRSVGMRLLHMWLADKDRLEELKILVGETGLGLLADIQMEQVEIHSAKKTEESVEAAYSIAFMPGSNLAGSLRYFTFNGLSAGTWRILQMLTYLVFDESSCMLLEQPEDCIHGGLLAKVIDVLRTYSDRTQLVCTTHSPRVMNLLGPSGIRLVTAKDGLTSVSKLDPKEIAAAESYIADEGTLTDFLDTL